MTSKTNPLNVILTVDTNSPYTALFGKFCGEFPVGALKLMYMNCTSAVSEGAYLRVTVAPEKDGAKEWTGRDPKLDCPPDHRQSR